MAYTNKMKQQLILVDEMYIALRYHQEILTVLIDTCVHLYK